MTFLANMLLSVAGAALPPQDPAQPFGAEFPDLDSRAVGEWWTKQARARQHGVWPLVAAGGWQGRRERAR